MGLNALVTHSSVPQLVQNLVLEGDWTAKDTLEYSRVGRVSEQAMLLNIAVRAAIDRCVNLHTFTWDLNAKLQGNVYSRLATLTHLRALRVRFPCTRMPQPTLEIPVIPRLKSLTITDYDPLCYPDDISNLLYHATGLEELHLHFNPRMREQGEPSVHLTHLFRKNIASERRLKLRKFGVYNLFARMDKREMLKSLSPEYLTDLTALNTFGRDEDEESTDGTSLATEFLDRTWMDDIESSEAMTVKSIRMDQLHRLHVPGINRGLERLYLVNARHGKTEPIFSDSPIDTEESSSNGASSGPSTSASGHYERANSTSSKQSKLRDLYLNAITTQAGPTLKHLIFPARWGLGIEQLARIIRSCPNLTQLSCHFDCTKFDMLRMLVPFLRGLEAIRLLAPPHRVPHIKDGKVCEKPVFLGKWDLASQEAKMRVELASGEFENLKWIGLRDWVWEVGGMEEVEEKVPLDLEDDGDDNANANGVGANGSGNVNNKSNGNAEYEVGEDGRRYRTEWVKRRKVRRVTVEDVMHVEIWRCDGLDVV
jgi:hypothetical protein